ELSVERIYFGNPAGVSVAGPISRKKTANVERVTCDQKGRDAAVERRGTVERSRSCGTACARVETNNRAVIATDVYEGAACGKRALNEWHGRRLERGVSRPERRVETEDRRYESGGRPDGNGVESIAVKCDYRIVRRARVVLCGVRRKVQVD